MGIFGVAQAEFDRVSAALAEAEAKLMEADGKLSALDRVQARIEFTPDGTIQDANDNFCNAMGYRLDEIRGQHHRIFVETNEANSSDYQNFWARLRSGEQIAQEFKRVGKGGRDIWIEASYSPIKDASGRVVKVVKYAIDTTKSKANAAKAAALEVCQANVMIADNDLNITYLNGTLQTMLSGNEVKLKTALPNFNASTLVGTCVDDFHKNPAHQRGMIRDLKGSYTTDLKVAGLTFGLIATPVIDEHGNRLGTVVEWNDKTAELARQEKEAEAAAENARIAAALKVCQANVMIANNDLEIVYINDSITKMLAGNEKKLQSVLPKFSMARLVGTCVDDFHKNPAHQRGMIRDLTSTYNTQLNLAGLTFDLIASPVFGPDGTRAGTVVEWKDITEELAREQQAAELAASNARIASALTVCQANVMIANNDLEIVYVNDSIKKMLAGNEKKLQSVLPKFNMANLVGTCVDDFHKNPAHQRGMIANLREAYNTQLNLAGLTFDLIASPVYGPDGQRLGTVVEWKDMTEQLAREAAEKQAADENKRIRQALDSVSTNAMIADGDFNIVYMNESVLGMMRNAEQDLRRDLPGFDTNKLMGANIDQFHKNPAHQRSMVGGLKGTYRGEITVGGRTFGLIANPINNDDGERIGTVVEWNDRTAEVAIEREIDGIVQGAVDGDLSGRIDLVGKEGFFRGLGEGLNQLVSGCENIIDDMLRVLGAMAKGDLTETVTNEYKGKFGQLKENSNQTIANLTDVISKITESATTVSTAADEMAQGNADLSQRTEEQASALEETASSMEEMTSTVKHSSDNAQEANGLSAEAAAKATRGGEVVTQAVTAMQGINEASKKIADIIGVIDEIAFQTNLLALNAAVEAARAGEQGRGFAVVAGEVRNLAQRSAAAAKEIKDLIRDSEARVEDGTRLVNDSGTTLTEIVEAVEKVSTTIAQIADAAREQTQGIEQVNKAVSQMDEMTQQNAALVEEASASSESMAEQARNMSNLVSFFRLSSSSKSGGFGGGPRASSSSSRGSAPAPSRAKTSKPSGGATAGGDDDWEEF